MAKKFIKLVELLLLVISLLVFVISLLICNMNKICLPLFIANMVIILSNILFSIEKKEINWIMIILQITIFTFLLGQILFCYIDNNFYEIELTQYELNFSNITIWISLIGIRFAYIIYFFLKPKRNKLTKTFNVNNNYIQNIRKISLLFFYLTYGFLMYALIDKIIFVNNYSYIESYTLYTSPLSTLASRISSVTIPSLYIFLGTMPTKKQCIKPLALYVFYSILTLGTQVRNKFVINLIMIFLYFIIRNRKDKKEKWVTKKSIITCLVIIPFIIIYLSILEYTRVGKSFDFSFWGLIRDFFKNQGGSIRVIGLSKRYEADLLKYSHNYLIGSIIWMFKYNVFNKLLFGIKEPITGTAAMAIQSNQLAHALTYIYNPAAYANGYGIGSCYIAESYIQFGLIGIFMISFIVGLISIYIENHILENKTPIKFAIMFMIISQVIYLPRSSFGNIISQVFTASNIIVFILINIIAKSKVKD